MKNIFDRVQKKRKPVPDHVLDALEGKVAALTYEEELDRSTREQRDREKNLPQNIYPNLVKALQKLFPNAGRRLRILPGVSVSKPTIEVGLSAGRKMERFLPDGVFIDLAIEPVGPDYDYKVRTVRKGKVRGLGTIKGRPKDVTDKVIAWFRKNRSKFNTGENLRSARENTMSKDLRKSLIRLAHEKPDLRPHLIPILKEAQGEAKTAGSMARHIKALKRMFPKSMVKDRAEFDGRSGAIWTSFGEDGVSNYYRAGWPDEHNPKLQAYMDKHGLWAEWYDAGTLMIYD